MKIRNGFVSNSSSSSFALVGKSFSLDENIIKMLFKNDLDSLNDKDDLMSYDNQEQIETRLEEFAKKYELSVIYQLESEYFTFGEHPKIDEKQIKDVRQKIEDITRELIDPNAVVKYDDVDFEYGEYCHG